MRDLINTELKTAMKAGQKRRVETLRLINAALKDRDIEARGQGKTLGDQDVLATLQKMVKSRAESLDIYTNAGRTDLAQVEAEEITIIQEFLPKQMSDAEMAQAVDAAIAEVGATSIKDMGKVVGTLKTAHAGRMDFAKASAAVKAKLTG